MPLRRSSLLALAAAALAAPRAALAQGTPAIRIGTSAAETYAQAFYAQELGLFTKAGLNVEIVTLATGSAVATAVAGGAVDIGVATVVSLANAIIRGLPFVMIAPSGMHTTKAPVGLLLVTKASTAKGPHDFEGTTIAVPSLKATADLAVRAWLVKGGADVGKVNIIEAPFAQMGDGLERGTYAAACVSEPALTNALAKGAVRVLADPFDAISPSFLSAGWFTTAAFEKANPDAVKKIATALTDAAKWANAHHNETAAIVAKVTKLDVEVIKGSIRSFNGEELKLADIQPQLDAALKFGFITRAVTANEILGR